MGRGRPPKLTDEVKALIAKLHIRNRWSVRVIQKKLPEFMPSLRGKVPGHTVINNYIRQVVIPNINKIKGSGIDKPWSMATLDQYPIPPEAIPAVLEVWKSRIQSKASHIISESKERARISGYTGDVPTGIDSEAQTSLMTSKADFTIREAKWVAQLSAIKTTTQELDYLANLYASTELIWQLMGKPFDSTALDRHLMGLPLDYTDPITLMVGLVHWDGAKSTMEQLASILPLGQQASKNKVKREEAQNER